MKTEGLRKFREGVLILVGLALLAAITESALLIPGMMRTVRNTDQATASTNQMIQAVTRQINGMQDGEKSIQGTMEKAGEAITQTSHRTENTLDHLNKTIDALTELEKHLDQSVNRQTLPQLTATLKQTQQAVGQLQDTAGQLNQTVRIINLETLPLIDQNLSQMKQLEIQATETVQHGNHVAGYYDRILTTPKKLGKKILWGVIGFAKQVGASAVALSF